MEYRHVVFTLPAPIADIAYQSKAAVYGLLFDIVAEVLQTIAGDPKHLGARVAATLVLHTWGSALTHPLHMHGIVPGGGLSADFASFYFGSRSHMMLVLSTLNAEGCVAAFLLDLTQRLHARGISASSLVLRMTREEIGSYLGLQLETVSRTFSKLQHEGGLEIRNRDLHVTDTSALQRLVQGGAR